MGTPLKRRSKFDLPAPTRSARPAGAPLARGRIALTLVIALIASAASASEMGASFSEGYRGTVTATLAIPEGLPMRGPSAAAVDAEGRVYVLDGVHNRIVVFSDGKFEREFAPVGDAALRQPLGLHLDERGQIWIADSGNSRVVVVSAYGNLIRSYPLPAGPDGTAADPTSVVPVGSAAWIADNENQRLLRLDTTSGAVTAVGSAGTALGQWQFPYQLAVTKSGGVVATDVLNGRAQLVDAGGAAQRNIGRYGIGEGEVYRPSGVAVDDSGNIWLADSVMGVVQVFRSDGSWIGALESADGGVLRFESPAGLTFGAENVLYVVESRGGRVARVEFEGFQRPAPSPRPQAPKLSGQQDQSCTVCHIDWLPPFSEERDSPLMPRPVGRRDEPPASSEAICFSCHDGSVADSRYRVWDEHGHQTGIVPPADITVPQFLPLVDGKLACRTCHSAHTTDAPRGDFRKAVMLRVPNQASELCASCHVDKTRGPMLGTHPTGGMPWLVPQALIDAGAKVGPNPRELTCQVCHTPHGASNDHLLVLGVTSNQLCVTCHDQLRPGMFRDGSHAEHPLEAMVNAEQRAAVEDMGTRLSPEGKLICLSCHKLHHGKADRFLLAKDLRDGQMCLQCHSDRASIAGTSHDLRTNHPTERNRVGMTPDEGGPCSACHLFHRYARAPNPTPQDTRGLCMTCHTDGKCAGDKAIGPVNHPGGQCSMCHNPHNTDHPKYMKEPTQTLCTTCHSDMAMVRGSAHDRTTAADWACAPNAPVDTCLSCHKPHGDALTGLFRLPGGMTDLHGTTQPTATGSATTQPVGGVLFGSIANPDDVCIACHSNAAFDRSLELAAAHPQTLPADRQTGGLPLIIDPETHAGRIGCRTCHNPHAAGGQNFLRTASTSQPTGLDEHGGATLCIRCHSDLKTIFATEHAPEKLITHGLNSQSCMPCHRLHGSEDALAELLWPKDLLAAAVPQPTHSDSQPSSAATSAAAEAHTLALVQTTDRYCVNCHSSGGLAPKPILASHPDVPMFAAEGSKFPLFDSEGRRSPTGHIGCRTCHLPHGRDGLLAAAPDADPRSLRVQIRQFEGPNVCIDCHGTDALRRYLYFHDPTRNRGAVTLR
ncbi:MAG: hypothetical protein AMXMBFR47_27730 [Planctomycetota bacterium]